MCVTDIIGVQCCLDASFVFLDWSREKSKGNKGDWEPSLMPSE